MFRDQHPENHGEVTLQEEKSKAEIIQVKGHPLEVSASIHHRVLSADVQVQTKDLYPEAGIVPYPEVCNEVAVEPMHVL
jgi:hypothetical protein